MQGIAGFIGGSSTQVIGGAGETTLKVPSITRSLTMADGPAAIRIKQIYGVDKKGIYDIKVDPIMESMMDFFPRIVRPFLRPPKKRKGKIFTQHTTAIPTGTALAQSFNLKPVANLLAKRWNILVLIFGLLPL